jgi:hypothetical protein
MSRYFFVSIALSFLALLAPFFFPWYVALLLGILAAFFFPPIVALTGLLLDVLYFNGHGWPYFTILGILCAGVTYLVHQFVKTRIMS